MIFRAREQRKREGATKLGAIGPRIQSSPSHRDIARLQNSGKDVEMVYIDITTANAYLAAYVSRKASDFVNGEAALKPLSNTKPSLPNTATLSSDPMTTLSIQEPCPC